MSGTGINACWLRDQVLMEEGTLRNSVQVDSSAKPFCDRPEKDRTNEAVYQRGREG